MATQIHATLLQRCQIAPEVTPGTAVPGDTLLPGFELMIAPDVTFNRYQPRGQKYPTIITPGQESAQISLSGPASFSELVYPAAGLFGKTTPTIPGGGTNSRQWLFNTLPAGYDDFQTYSMEQGDNISAIKASYCVCTEFGMEFTRQECTVNGSFVGQKVTTTGSLGVNTVFHSILAGTNSTTTFQYQTLSPLPAGTTPPITLSGSDQSSEIQTALEAIVGAGNVLVVQTANHEYDITFRGRYGQISLNTPANFDGSASGGSGPGNTISRTTNGIVPTMLTQNPILPYKWRVKVADTQAGLGAASWIDHAISFSWRIGDKYGPFFAANTTDLTSTGFTGIVETQSSTEANLMLGWGHATAQALVATMRAGDTKFLRLNAQGALIEGSIYEELTIDMALKVGKVFELSDSDGLWAVQWPFEIVNESVWGKAIEMTVVNTVAAL